MSPDQERTLRIAAQAVRGCHESLSDVAFTILGIVMLAGAVMLLFVAHWIWRGGLQDEGTNLKMPPCDT